MTFGPKLRFDASSGNYIMYGTVRFQTNLRAVFRDSLKANLAERFSGKSIKKNLMETFLVHVFEKYLFETRFFFKGKKKKTIKILRRIIL